MAKTIGYLITWTTYGTWLQGDKRGYVKDGQVLQWNERLFKDNEQKLCKDSVPPGLKERKAVQQAIEEEAKKHNLRLYSISVCSNHVHIVTGYCSYSIGDVVRQFKQAGTAVLKGCGITGKVWTKGYDKRYCFDEQSLRTRVEYVNRHIDL